MTIDDRLLDQLGERARERADDDIAVESRRAADESPPSAEFKRQVVTEILRRQREETEAESDSESGTPPDDSSDDVHLPSVRPFAAPARRPRPWLRSLAAAASVSLALGVAWWSSAPPPPDPATLMPYSVETLGVAAESRGTTPPTEATDEIATGRYLVGNRVELRLRPDAPIDDPVDASAWRQVGPDWRPWAVDLSVSDQGAVRVRTIAGDPALPIGEHSIRVDVTVGSDGEAGDTRSWFWRLRVEPSTDGAAAP